MLAIGENSCLSVSLCFLKSQLFIQHGILNIWCVKGVEGNATLVYELTLVKFEKAKESWQVILNPDAFHWIRIGTVSNVLHQLDAEQKLEQARIFKEKGTKHFKVYLILHSFPLCNRCANVSSGDSEYLLLSLQDQKYEIASSRYQKVIFLESAGYLITWGVE